MAPPFSSDDNHNATYFTAVAIDKDKNSQFAVKWAIDHLLLNNPNIILIHVRTTRNFQSHQSNHDPNESETQQLFLPYRGFCARKGVDEMEVVLNGTDVSTAIIDYINTNNYIKNIVVGASTRNALTRKFRHADVGASLTKYAPHFCTVYVISKGKPMTVRSANRAGPSRQPSPRELPPHLPPDHSDTDDIFRTSSGRGGWRSLGSERKYLERYKDYMNTPTRSSTKSTPNKLSMDSLHIPIRTPENSTSRDSFSDDIDFSGSLGFRSVDISAENLEFAITSESPRASISSQSPRYIEAEMKRLKLELKQTMDMYSTACKEAISAKQKTKELHQWKMEGARWFEEARISEEAALEMAEMEKAKCKAAIEAAEAAQRLAELEAHKRKNAERKAKRDAEDKKRALNTLANNDVRYRKYSIEEIEVATDYFSESSKIGEGGYGPVYKASLGHTPVAIKALRPDAAQGKKQFQQEVEVLSCIRHPNMVLLLGACPEYGCLVYEYMENGSLEDRLFRRNDTPSMPWRLRFKISAEIATGLLFLHQAKPEPLVHRDLKPANILLDRNYVSKISDVGLARLVPPHVANSVTQYHMTSAAGTFCYIDPEYQQTGMLGIKSDIYSLGIMLLQIITAKPAMGLTHHVEKAIERGSFPEMLDPTVPDWPVEEALVYAKLALKCAELKRKDRPDLSSVVLPELNRLRKLGTNSEASSSGSLSYGLRSYNTNSRPRLSYVSQVSKYLDSFILYTSPHAIAF
ncbi:hypothetical protein HHK36_014333 [Tetracentron sinense]|uniref:RING-type E3 ubiquitin transferase n=1 Tax=Tetracentron sinense TaxID=13715 RepID=A0A834Z5W7_TETSI|nr:hypothetical protein HHK36_014333 [Tetracentron sinense]